MPRSWKVAYAIVERGGKKHWLRVGLAFVNRDGSLNVRLDAVPFTGQLHIRDSPSGHESGEPLASGDLPDAPTQPTSASPAVPPDKKRRP